MYRSTLSSMGGAIGCPRIGKKLDAPLASRKNQWTEAGFGRYEGTGIPNFPRHIVELWILKTRAAFPARNKLFVGSSRPSVSNPSNALAGVIIG